MAVIVTLIVIALVMGVDIYFVTEENKILQKEVTFWKDEAFTREGEAKSRAKDNLEGIAQCNALRAELDAAAEERDSLRARVLALTEKPKTETRRSKPRERTRMPRSKADLKAALVRFLQVTPHREMGMYKLLKKVPGFEYKAAKAALEEMERSGRLIVGTVDGNKEMRVRMVD